MVKRKTASAKRSKSQRGLHRCLCEECVRHPYGTIAKEHQAINRVLRGLDERNKRRFAGLLASQRGNILQLSEITGLSRTTIYRGQSEVERPSHQRLSSVRHAGGGRWRVEKNNPELRRP